MKINLSNHSKSSMDKILRLCLCERNICAILKILMVINLENINSMIIKYFNNLNHVSGTYLILSKKLRRMDIKLWLSNLLYFLKIIVMKFK